MQRPLHNQMCKSMRLKLCKCSCAHPMSRLQHFHPVNSCSNPTAKSLHCFFTFSSKMPVFAMSLVQLSSKIPVFAVAIILNNPCFCSVFNAIILKNRSFCSVFSAIILKNPSFCKVSSVVQSASRIESSVWPRHLWTHNKFAKSHENNSQKNILRNRLRQVRAKSSETNSPKKKSRTQ